ncbi:MAG: hypothetical protein ACW98A_12725 [Candidatus Hodarchaeales archaeon]
MLTSIEMKIKTTMFTSTILIMAFIITPYTQASMNIETGMFF